MKRMKKVITVRNTKESAVSASRVGLHARCFFLLMAVSVIGCGPAGHDSPVKLGGTQPAFDVSLVTDNKVNLQVLAESSKTVALYIGEKKWGSSPVAVGKNGLTTSYVSLETSDQLQLETGGVGHGIIFSRGGKDGKISVKQFLAITEGGAIPYGMAKIRKAEGIVEAVDSITLADIERVDGSKVPISVKLY
jgi:hypothetical protein